MKNLIFAMALFAAVPALAVAADAPAAKEQPRPVTSKVDPAKAAEHERADIQRHRAIAAAHEAAAKCLESGTAEDVCNAALAKACGGIAYGKYCGMKHPD